MSMRRMDLAARRLDSRVSLAPRTPSLVLRQSRGDADMTALHLESRSLLTIQTTARINPVQNASVSRMDSRVRSVPSSPLVFTP